MSDFTSYCNPLTIIMTWPHPIAKGTGRCNSPPAQNRGDLLCMALGVFITVARVDRVLDLYEATCEVSTTACDLVLTQHGQVCAFTVPFPQ